MSFEMPQCNRIRDAADPRLERARVAELVQPTVNPEKRLLTKLVRIVRMPHETKHDVRDETLVLAHEPLERARAPRKDGFDELTVGAHGSDGVAFPSRYDDGSRGCMFCAATARHAAVS
jgi:hypothetical protein